MVKVPMGEKVEIDLWNSKKNRGMVKYFTTTMDLVRAESEFILKKGDTAFVVETFDNFVVVVPEDEYSSLIHGSHFKDIDYKGLNHLIWKLLKDWEDATGGILSFEEIFSILRRTSIQAIITKKLLKKSLKHGKIPFDFIKKGANSFVSLKMEDITQDKTTLLNLSKN